MKNVIRLDIILMYRHHLSKFVSTKVAVRQGPKVLGAVECGYIA